MMLVRCYLAPSPIEGLGVFCHDDIKAGQEVWRLDTRFDRLIPVEDLETAPEHVREFLDRYAYPPEPGSRFLCLDFDEGRFMNHADVPNTDFTNPAMGIALVDIPAGTEITCDYACFTWGELTFQPPRHKVAPIHLNGQAA
jgi:uncharacterized protein